MTRSRSLWGIHRVHLNAHWSANHVLRNLPAGSEFSEFSDPSGSKSPIVHPTPCWSLGWVQIHGGLECVFWDLSFIFHLIFDYNAGGVFNACADPFYQEIYHLVAGFQSTTAPDSTYPMLGLHSVAEPANGVTCSPSLSPSTSCLGSKAIPTFHSIPQPTQTLSLHGHRQRVRHQTPFHFPNELPRHTPTQELVLNGHPLLCSRPDFSKTCCHTAQSYIYHTIPTHS